MIYSYGVLGFEEFFKLIKEERYDILIDKCYYCDNQLEIIGFLERFLSMNSVIINYIYIRNCHKAGMFQTDSVLKRCFAIALRTVYITIMQINVCLEINKSFVFLDILLKKIDEKFGPYMTIELLESGMKLAKKDILNFIDAMTLNINEKSSPSTGDMNKKLDLPEPYILCNIKEGTWRYPAINYEYGLKEELKSKFINNYGGRCQKYYDAYHYTVDKFNQFQLKFILNNQFKLYDFFKS